MSERPFMQLYPSDFVGDTLQLSPEQIGVYLLMLMAMWNADGELPNDDVKLARVARLSLKKWRSVAPDIMPFFTVDGDKVTHRRLTKELQKSERQSQSRSAAGVKGFQAKSLKYNNAGQANAQAGLKHSPEPYRKGRATLSGQTEGMVALDRWSDEALFKACESLTKKVPGFMQKQSFPAAIVDQARKQLSH